MIGFRRRGHSVVAEVEQNEAQVIAMVVAQVAGLIEHDRAERGGGPPVDELDDLGPFGVPDAAARDDLPVAGEQHEPDPLGADSLRDGDPRLDDPSAAEIMAELSSGKPKPPADPVLARLFPDGYRDDPDAAAELRGLIEEDLRAQKLENVNTLLATLPLDGGKIRLDGGQAEAWLLALNDARLVVGTRLEVTDDMDILDELDEAVLRDPTGPRVFALSVYQLLGYLQESLVEALAD